MVDFLPDVGGFPKPFHSIPPVKQHKKGVWLCHVFYDHKMDFEKFSLTRQHEKRAWSIWELSGKVKVLHFMYCIIDRYEVIWGQNKHRETIPWKILYDNMAHQYILQKVLKNRKLRVAKKWKWSIIISCDHLRPEITSEIDFLSHFRSN